MKKIMMIAVLVSSMLMPAQLMAKNGNRENGRGRIEARNTRHNNRKEMRVESRHHKPVTHHNTRPAVVHHRPAPRPVVVHHHPAPRPAVVHHHPAPRPVVVHHHPTPRPVVVHHCDNEVASAAAVAIGVVGLISLLAN